MKKLICVISIVGFISCEKVIPFDEEIVEPKLVINGVFHSDTTWRIHVSSSRSVVDSTSYKNITNASVFISDGDENLIEELIHDTNGFYLGNTNPQENLNYHLSIYHPTIDSVFSQSTLPTPVNFTGIDTTTSNSNGEKYLELTVHFEDPGNASNYYFIETYVIGLRIETLNEDTLYEIDTSKANMLLTDEVFQDGGSPWKDQGLFNDLLFNGQTKSLEISIPNNEFKGSEGGETSTYKNIGLRFYIYNISQDYFFHLRGLELYDQTSNNPFAQPVQVFSNIQNGFGIFAGTQVKYFDIEL